MLQRRQSQPVGTLFNPLHDTRIPDVVTPPRPDANSEAYLVSIRHRKRPVQRDQVQSEEREPETSALQAAAAATGVAAARAGEATEPRIQATRVPVGGDVSRELESFLRMEHWTTLAHGRRVRRRHWLDTRHSQWPARNLLEAQGQLPLRPLPVLLTSRAWLETRQAHRRRYQQLPGTPCLDSSQPWHLSDRRRSCSDHNHYHRCRSVYMTTFIFPTTL